MALPSEVTFSALLFKRLDAPGVPFRPAGNISTGIATSRRRCRVRPRNVDAGKTVAPSFLSARAAVLCATWTCGRGRSRLKCVAPLSASLRQLRPLVALPAGVPGGARRRADSARASAWCRDGGETAFCAARRPSCRCFRGVSVRARSVCNFSSHGIAALFTVSGCWLW